MFFGLSGTGKLQGFDEPRGYSNATPESYGGLQVQSRLLLRKSSDRELLRVWKDPHVGKTR